LTTKIAKSGICDGVQDKVSGNIKLLLVDSERERERVLSERQRGDRVLQRESMEQQRTFYWSLG
jgi:hypothetical protein